MENSEFVFYFLYSFQIFRPWRVHDDGIELSQTIEVEISEIGLDIHFRLELKSETKGVQNFSEMVKNDAFTVFLSSMSVSFSLMS